MRRIEGLRDWLGLHKREKKGREEKRDKGGKPFYGKVCSIDKKAQKLLYFKLEAEARNPHFLWK
jgi:hypothetical protein